MYIHKYQSLYGLYQHTAILWHFREEKGYTVTYADKH